LASLVCPEKLGIPKYKVGEDDGPLGNGPRRGLLRERQREGAGC